MQNYYLEVGFYLKRGCLLISKVSRSVITVITEKSGEKSQVLKDNLLFDVRITTESLLEENSSNVRLKPFKDRISPLVVIFFGPT